MVVLALALLDDHADEADVATVLAERERVGEALSLHLSAVSSRAVAAVVGDYCFALVPARPGSVADDDPDVPHDDSSTVARNFLDRLSSPHRVVIGVGDVAVDVTGLRTSRQQAERAVRVLRAQGADRQVARLRDVQIDALVLEMADRAAARRERPFGVVERLSRYDARHDANLVETLEAWLNHFGDIPAAARSVYTHPNTFRYRLRRVAEVGELDLDNADARFGVMLHLRVWPRHRDAQAP